MNRLFKKMFVDIWKLKAQFISIFLMCFVGILIYTGIEGVWNGMQNQIQKYYIESNLADFWINGIDFSESQVSEILNLEDVINVEKVAIVNANIENDFDTEVRLIVKESNEISKPYKVDGEKYINSKTGIWLSSSYAKTLNINVNDKVTLRYGDSIIKASVLGIVYGPEYVSYIGSSSSIMPNPSKFTYAYVSKDILEALSGSLKYNQMGLTLKESCDKSKLKTEIRNVCKSNYIGSFDRTEYAGVSNYINKVEQIKKMSIMFSAVFLLLALLTIQTTMKRIVNKQRTQIGILKALGFYSWQIELHYSLYGLIISSLGAVAGYFTAPYTVTPQLLNLQKEFYDVPFWKGETSKISIILIMAMISVCTFTAHKACKKVVKELPVYSLRDENSRYGKKLFIENFNVFWNNISFEWKWTLRDVFQNKSRTIIGVIGVLGSLTLLMASFGIQDSVKKVNQNIYGNQYSYYKKIGISNISDEEKGNAESILQGDFQWISEGNAEVRSKSRVKTCAMNIIDNGYYFTITNLNGSVISLPNDGIVISETLAKELGVSENEEIKIYELSKNYVVRIDKIISINTPQAIFIASAYWEKIGGVFMPTSLLVGNNSNIVDIENENYSKDVHLLDFQLKEADDVLRSIKAIIFMLIAAAVLLSVVILYNLGLLSYTERSREYATLRVLGFYNSELKSLIFKDSVFTIIIGLMFGIPCGVQFLKIYVGAVSTSTINYFAYLSVVSFAIALTITIGCSLAVCYLVSRKVKSIDMVEALKSIE